MANAFGSNINSSLENALDLGANRANAGVGSAQNGVNYVLDYGATINGDADSMRNQARLVNAQGNALNTTAGEVKTTAGEIKTMAGRVKGLADDLTPYADDLSDKGDTLWGQGSALYDEAKDVFGQGKALVSLDPTATGLAGEFVKQYGYLSPDRYVSRAASDTQSSYDNAQGQSERELARRGVSLSSGAAQSLMQKYKQNLASALAGAKTRARQTGIDEQTKMLSTMTSAANTLYNMGNTTAQSATSMQNAGVDAKAKAAGVISDAGDLYSKAGSLESSAGQLQSSAGSLRQAAGQLYSNAASIFGDAGSLSLSYAKTVQSAYKDLADAQNAAAKYYLDAAATEVSANNGGSRGGGSSTVTSSSDFDPWESTGHSSSWWKNSLSDEAFTAMASDMAGLAAGVAAS